MKRESKPIAGWIYKAMLDISPEVALLVRINEIWPEIAGKLASDSEPCAVKHGKLIVCVENEQTGVMLNAVSDRLLTELNRYLPNIRVDAVVCTTEWPDRG